MYDDVKGTYEPRPEALDPVSGRRFVVAVISKIAQRKRERKAEERKEERKRKRKRRDLHIRKSITLGKDTSQSNSPVSLNLRKTRDKVHIGGLDNRSSPPEFSTDIEDREESKREIVGNEICGVPAIPQEDLPSAELYDGNQVSGREWSRNE